MRCSRCGNENPDGNRFCGMCGAALLSAPPVAATSPQRPVTAGPAIPSAPASRPQTVEAPRSAPAAQSQPSPPISGPSFLGLNDRSPHRRTRASLSIDPHSSSNVEYLLDDDDEPRHFGAGKVLLILIALGLAVGFGYLRWKNQGLSWLNVALHKPAAAVQNQPATDSNAAGSNANDGNAPASPSITPDTQPAPSSAPASAAAQPSSTAQPSGAPQPPGSQPAATSAPNGNPPAAAAPLATAPASTPANAAPANNTAPSGDAATPPANAAAKPSDDSPAASGDSATSSKGNAPAAAPPKPAPKPRAARPAAPEPAVDPVAEAHPYLYGRGSSQDCDRGLRILKPAANAGNPKAMIEMGALYSAGLCTPHDLPTAYRWFALALRKDPSNDQVQTDLQKLWSEMTQPERQLAIKLSQ